jgi:hypothetical protein
MYGACYNGREEEYNYCLGNTVYIAVADHE